jgi:hypothetical protein
MFIERGPDRRRAYSFRSHFRLIARAKGWRYFLSALLATLALTGVVLASCEGGSSITAPNKTERPGLLVVSTPEQQQTVPAEFLDPCTGEFVQGTLEARYSSDFDPPTLHATVKFRYRFTGNGLKVLLDEYGNPVLDEFGNPVRVLTGTSYSGSEEYNEEGNANVGAEKLEFTSTDNVRIFATNFVSEAMDDFLMHVNVHATVFISPTRMTAEVANPFVDCK